jgi:hypothetical protein
MIIIPAATMMQASFASLIAIVILGILVFLMRAVAHLEGRQMEREKLCHVYNAG